MTMIDETTNIRLALFSEEETTVAAMGVFSLWIKKYGILQALYCDKKNAFVMTQGPMDAELLSGIPEPRSHFGRTCDKLGVDVIPANNSRQKGGWNGIMDWTRTVWSKSCGLPASVRLRKRTAFCLKPASPG
jgi:hypothetical protein